MSQATDFLSGCVENVLSLIVIAEFILKLWLALTVRLVVPIMFWLTQFVALHTPRLS